MADDPYSKRLLWFVFGGSRGGINRLRIIRALIQKPSNINQLAVGLGIDYKGIQHHIRMLEKNNLVLKEGEKYNITYSASPFLEVNRSSFEEVAAKLEKSK